MKGSYTDGTESLIVLRSASILFKKNGFVLIHLNEFQMNSLFVHLRHQKFIRIVSQSGVKDDIHSLEHLNR